jgi:hypothetical protein
MKLPMRIIAAIQAPAAIRKILDCHGLPSRPPPISPALYEQAFFQAGNQQFAPEGQSVREPLMSLLVPGFFCDIFAVVGGMGSWNKVGQVT